MPQVIIDAKRCKGCYLCCVVCPEKLLKQSARLSERGVYPSEAAAPDACIGCMRCVLVCPDATITILDNDATGGARDGKKGVKPVSKATRRA
jgi:2-oxoglutarate ferredoxin oxidoreductase subunit delta